MLPSPPPSSTSTALLGGNSYRNFIEAIHSPATCIVYKDSLKHYMSCRKVQDCDQLLEGDVRLIQSQLIDYVIYLRQEQKLVARTINANMAAIRKFYDTNDIDLKWKKIKMYVHRNGNGRGKKKKDRGYTHFEISKMLEKADQRARVVILLMCSSGIRIGAFPYIKLRNLEKIERYNLYKLTVYEGEKEEYITFCTPECAAAIDSYLECRQRHGERPLKEDSPLIREEFDVNDEIMAANPKTLGMEAFRRMVRRVGFDSGVMERHGALVGPSAKRGQRLVKETHGFRKFFQTTTVSNGMSMLYSEFLMGHRSGGLAIESYVRPSENDLLEGNDKMIGYVGVIDALTINEEHKLRLKVETLTLEKSKVESALTRIHDLYKRLGLA